MKRILFILIAAIAIVSCDSTSSDVPTQEDGSIAPSNTSSTAIAPSDVSSSPLNATQAEPVEQALSDLNAEGIDSGQIRITLPESVLFDFDEADIRADAQETLSKVAEVIAYYRDAPVQIEGHTDNKGDTAYNQELSERRANAVADYLSDSFDVSRERLETEGLGESQPVAENEKADGSDNPEGRQQNRRVEVVVDAREVTDSEASPDVVDPSGE